MTKPQEGDMPELKYWWSDDEEIIRSEAFDTREDAYSDAYCSRATCFDDPSQQDGFYLHHGKMVDNPDYDADYAKHYGGFDEDNCPQIFEGKTERIEALTVTDFFHDQWAKLTRASPPPQPTGITIEEGSQASEVLSVLQMHGSKKPTAQGDGARAIKTTDAPQEDIDAVEAALHPAPVMEVQLVHEMNPVLEDLRWWQHSAQNYGRRQDFTDGYNAAISNLMKKYGNTITITKKG
jgi:hypothetical protein